MYVKFLLLLIITCVSNEIVLARSIRKYVFKGRSAPETSYEIPKFDYDHAIASRGFPYSAYRQMLSPTTQNSVLSYWQNIMRNVRLPVPSISWNVTNPLMGLLNMGGEQPIQSTPPEDTTQTSHTRRRHKNRRRTNSHKKRRRNKTKIGNTDHQLQDEPSTEEQEFLLPPYPNPAYADETMYFYDPNTDSYYSVHRVKALGSYIEGIYYGPGEKNHITARKTDKTQGSIAAVSKLDNVMNISTKDDSDYLDEERNINVYEKDNLQKLRGKSQKSSAYNEEMRSNVLGNNAYNFDNNFNRQRQRAKDQRNKNSTFQQKPRNSPRYYFLVNKSQ